MSEVALRIETIAPHEIDRMICALGELSLQRDVGGTFIVVPERTALRAAAMLGRCGLGAAIAEPIVPPVHAIATIVAHLTPFGAAEICDRVWITPVDAGRASQRARRGILRRYDPDRLRLLLRDEDRAYLWRRIAWIPRSLLRSAGLRGIRPIVFDRAALTTGHLRWGFTRAADLARWLVP